MDSINEKPTVPEQEKIAMIEYIHSNIAESRELIKESIFKMAENEAEVYVSTKLGISSSDDNYTVKKNCFIELFNEEIIKML